MSTADLVIHYAEQFYQNVVNESRDQIIAQGYEPCKICQP